jgi:hypothetical protein
MLITGLLYKTFRNWAYDDPFITYRYAENLLHGLGFVYNAGERVLSTTTPLFTLLLALLGNLWPDLPHLANLLSAFSLAIGGLFLWDLAQAWKAPIMGWSGLLLYPTFPLLVTTLGSETLLYLAFCLGTFAFYVRRRYPVAAVLAAMAVLTRPDGILVVFVLAGHYLLKRRSHVPWLALALFLGLTIPWFAFAWVYFGSPIPATLFVKQHQGAMAISQKFAPGLLTVLRPYVQWPYLLELGLAAIGLFFIIRRYPQWRLLLIWTLLYFLAYTALGVSRYFWYYAPLVPGFIVLLGLGITGISEFFSSHKTHLFNLIMAIVFLALVLVQSVNLWQSQKYIDSRLSIYTSVGKWLSANTPPNTSVGTLEVGIIGYYAERRMVDFAGLLQPDVSNQLSKTATYEDAALWAIDQYHPDYLVLYDKNFPRLEQGYVAQHCQARQEFRGKDYRYSGDLIIYFCK